MDKRPNSFVFFSRLRYQLTVAPIFFCVLGLRTSSSTMWNNHAIHVIRIAGLGPALIVRFSFLNPITVAVCRRARNAGKFLQVQTSSRSPRLSFSTLYRAATLPVAQPVFTLRSLLLNRTLIGPHALVR